MDLKDFIANTLISIKAGVAEANRETNNSFKINAEAKVVNFDIAVEVSNEGKIGAGGGLKIHVVEASLGKNSSTKESRISRINFTVGVNSIIS